ncbi:MAG TPA: DUF1801 domain-containing protein [Humisphaera sp.]
MATAKKPAVAKKSGPAKKPKPTASPADYIAALPEGRRQDVRALHDLIVATVPKLAPCMVGSTLGFGPFHYRYASGREGDTAIVCVASQKNHISMYVCSADETGYIAERYREALPKADIGKSCVRFKTLADLDLTVVKKLLKHAEKVGGAGAVT